MRKVLIQVLVSVMILVIGTGIGIIVEKYQAKIRFLEVKTITVENFLPVKSVLGDDAEIIIKGRKVKNISMVMLSLFNYTDKDFADVPIYIDLIPKDGTAIDILQQQVVGPNELPEAIQEIPGVNQSRIKGAKRFGYLIKNVNRTPAGNTNDTVLYIQYSLAGNKAPQVKVATDKLGLGLHVSSW